MRGSSRTGVGKKACESAIKKNGLVKGGKGWNFEGNYVTKGCYAYTTLRSPVRKLRTQKLFRRLSHVERPNQKQRLGRILLTLKSSKNNLSKVKKAA